MGLVFWTQQLLPLESDFRCMDVFSLYPPRCSQTLSFVDTLVTPCNIHTGRAIMATIKKSGSHWKLAGAGSFVWHMAQHQLDLDQLHQWNGSRTGMARFVWRGVCRSCYAIWQWAMVLQSAMDPFRHRHGTAAWIVEGWFGNGLVLDLLCSIWHNTGQIWNQLHQMEWIQDWHGQICVEGGVQELLSNLRSC